MKVGFFFPTFSSSSYKWMSAVMFQQSRRLKQWTVVICHSQDSSSLDDSVFGTVLCFRRIRGQKRHLFLMALSQRNWRKQRHHSSWGEKKNVLSALGGSLQRLWDYQYRFCGKECLQSTADISKATETFLTILWLNAVGCFATIQQIALLRSERSWARCRMLTPTESCSLVVHFVQSLVPVMLMPQVLQSGTGSWTTVFPRL